MQILGAYKARIGQVTEMPIRFTLQATETRFQHTLSFTSVSFGCPRASSHASQKVMNPNDVNIDYYIIDN